MFFQLIQQYNVQKLSLRFLFLWDAVEAQAEKKKLQLPCVDYVAIECLRL